MSLKKSIDRIPYIWKGKHRAIISPLAQTAPAPPMSDGANQSDHTFPQDPDAISQPFPIYFSKQLLQSVNKDTKYVP